MATGPCTDLLGIPTLSSALIAPLQTSTLSSALIAPLQIYTLSSALIAPLRSVMELFTYVRMGGKPESCHVKLLGETAATLADAFSTFDASKARCHVDSDRQRLLAVVESTFGTTAPFNTRVREIFNEKVFQGQLRTRTRNRRASSLQPKKYSKKPLAGGTGGELPLPPPQALRTPHTACASSPKASPIAFPKPVVV